MTMGETKIRDVVAGSPDAEEVLEEAGIDYWFGLDQELRRACETAKIDPVELRRRLASCSNAPAGDTQCATLATLLNDSDEQWRAQLAPAIAQAVAAAAALPDGRGKAAGRLLKSLLLALTRHMKTSRALLRSAEAIEEARPGSVDRQTLRLLRLEHLDFDRIAGDLRSEASRLAAAPDAAELCTALRTVIRETHRHIKVAHNFILPRLVPAVQARAVQCEPW